jgi:chromosomal replication initiator protein
MRLSPKPSVATQQRPKTTWDRILKEIESRVSGHSYSTWFEPTQQLGEDESQLTVAVPNHWFADWLRTHYSVMIEEALKSVGRPGLELKFFAESEDQSHGSVATPSAPKPTATPAPKPTAGNGQALSSRLNPRYRFESFVVSSCNQFAHAASMAVAEQPKRAYNPLYLYGGVGLGKTHLMQAIGNRIAARGDLQMTYISAEYFMNELIQSIRYEKTLEFKERFRNVDILLIDDIQFLAGKERTQEEFFHTFNALYDAEKQIVITSDVPPREIPTLEDRLRSRFEWGLMADLQPPDLETKMAILAKKAEAEGAELPDDVALFIASSCKSSIRELEGAMIRVVAYASMSGKEINLDLAKQTLGSLIATESPSATVDTIQKLIGDYYNLRVSQLKSRTNAHQVAFPRQIAMFICKQLTRCSLKEIGQRFGGKHHSTVIHAVQKIEKMKKGDAEFHKLIEEFIESLK